MRNNLRIDIVCVDIGFVLLPLHRKDGASAMRLCIHVRDGVNSGLIGSQYI